MTTIKRQTPGNIRVPMAACGRDSGKLPLRSLAMPDIGRIAPLPGRPGASLSTSLAASLAERPLTQRLAQSLPSDAGWAQAAADALGVIGLPAAVLSGAGRLAAANRLIERLIPQIVRDRPTRLGLSDRRADALLGEALLRVQAGGGEAHAIPLAATPALPTSIVRVFPAGDVSGGAAACLVVITAVARPQTVSVRFIEEAFDLTPAEARVACGIAAGRTVGDIAAAAGLATGTVRQQLKSVFSKTGISRQADLVRLLAGLVVSPLAGSAPGFP